MAYGWWGIHEKTIMDSCTEESRLSVAIQSSWTGSLANIMQARSSAIGALSKHERPDIAEAAKTVCEKMSQWVEHQKESEQREDSEREQRFE